MTNDTIAETAALKALLSETSDHQILAELQGFVADCLMALDVDQLCGAGTHERSTVPANTGTGIVTAAGRHGLGPSMFRFSNCGDGHNSLSFWNRACAWRSTNALTPSSPDRWKGNGPAFGWTPPISRSGALGGSSEWQP